MYTDILIVYHILVEFILQIYRNRYQLFSDITSEVARLNFSTLALGNLSVNEVKSMKRPNQISYLTLSFSLFTLQFYIDIYSCIDILVSSV